MLRLQQLVDEVRRGERHLVGDGRVVGYLRLRKLCANGTYDTDPNSGKTPYTFGMDPDEMMLNSPHRQFVRATDGQMIVGMHGAMSNYMDAFGMHAGGPRHAHAHDSIQVGMGSGGAGVCSVLCRVVMSSCASWGCRKSLEHLQRAFCVFTRREV